MVYLYTSNSNGIFLVFKLFYFIINDMFHKNDRNGEQMHSNVK